MLVRVLRDCYVNGYRVKGTEFEYDGPPNRHLEPLHVAQSPEIDPPKRRKKTAAPVDSSPTDEATK